MAVYVGVLVAVLVDVFVGVRLGVGVTSPQPAYPRKRAEMNRSCPTSW